MAGDFLLRKLAANRPDLFSLHFQLNGKLRRNLTMILCAALILSKLVANAQRNLHLENCSVHLSADSSVTFALIRSSPHLWQTFVANQTSDIQGLGHPLKSIT